LPPGLAERATGSAMSGRSAFPPGVLHEPA
jgi:hypothetical protein